VTITTIGPVKLADKRKANAFVLKAVEDSDCKVDELVDGLCRAIRPKQIAAELDRIAEEISSAERGIPQLTHLSDVHDARVHLNSLREEHEELASVCRLAAHDFILRLAAANSIILDGDVVRAV
jgi:hypothetical protein